jgi:uncharacterized protein (DUF885 family)
MKKSLITGLLLLVLGACGGGGNNAQQPPTVPPPPTTASEQLASDLQGLSLNDYYDVSIGALVQRSPETIIWRSLLDVYPPAAATLDSLSDGYRRETFAMYQVALDALLTYDRSTLDAEGQLDYDVYEWFLQDVVDRLPFIYHDFAATYGVFGVPRETEQLFTEVHPLNEMQDAEDYVTRLGRVETKFAQLADHLMLQQQNGIVEPALTMQVAINQVAAMAQMAADQNPYYTRLADDIGNIPGLSQAQRDDLLNRALSMVDRGVRRAYQNLLLMLQGLHAIAPASIGVGQYPDGSAYYQYALQHHTTTDLTAAEIHQLGLDELVRIRAQMDDIFVNQLGYDLSQDPPLRELFARVAADGGIIPAANVKSTYEAIIDLAKQNVSDAFDIFPSSDVIVIGGPFGGYYIGPSTDGTRPGAFYAGTQNDEPWFQMRSLAYHEAIPGHHTQIAIGLDQNLPVPRQAARSTAFIEGWALYAERLAWELGWHENDSYSNLGRLQYEALRASRLVMDTGIHSMGWTFDQAAQFNVDNIGATVGSSQGAAGRYSVWPGQATAYMIGMLKFLSERQRAMDAMGVQFDLKAFHRALLTNGPVPLSALDEIVDRYIADTLAAP